MPIRHLFLAAAALAGVVAACSPAGSTPAATAREPGASGSPAPTSPRPSIKVPTPTIEIPPPIY
jgi:hypothetical protein